MKRAITISVISGVILLLVWFGVSYFSQPGFDLKDSLSGLIGIQPRDEDLGMTLPQPINPENIGETVFISINAQGHVLFGKDKQLLDQDASVRDLPLLKAELEKAKQRAGGKEVLVNIYTDPAVTQQRVIDCLNALAMYGISSVTFSDLIEEQKAPEEQKIELQREIDEGRQNINNLEAFVQMERAKLKEDPNYDQSFLDEALEEQKEIREAVESGERRLQELDAGKK